MELEGACKAIDSKPLLKAGIQTKVDWAQFLNVCLAAISAFLTLVRHTSIEIGDHLGKCWR